MLNKTPKTPPENKSDAPLKPLAPPPSKPPSMMISSYKKRQQIGPFVIWGLVVLLVFAGLILLVVWLTSANGPKISLFATETPTPTTTPSPTSTPTFTATATETPTATITLSPTPDKPFEYTIQEGDSLDAISTKFNLGDNGVALLFLLNPTIDPATANVSVGQKIIIPNPDMKLPTATPIPPDLKPGTQIDYTIQAGDTIAGIAAMYNSTFEDILTENNITDANKIFVGQEIVIRANLVTPTASPQPTITPGPSATPPSPFTPTPPGGIAPTVTPTATP